MDNSSLTDFQRVKIESERVFIKDNLGEIYSPAQKRAFDYAFREGYRHGTLDAYNKTKKGGRDD